MYICVSCAQQNLSKDTIGINKKLLGKDIIKEVWPLVKEITCCYDYREDDEIKKKMTEHLAELAGLCVVE